MKRLSLALVLGAAVLSGCAPSVRPRVPEAEEYVRPQAPPGDRDVARILDRAWTDITTGRAHDARRRLESFLRKRPGHAAAEAMLGWARLAAGAPAEARQRFEGVVAREPRDPSALAGAGTAALRTGDVEAAWEMFRRAGEAAPGNPVIARRVADVRLQVTDRRVTAAREARDAGRDGAAEAEYRRVLELVPDLSGVRVELADLLAARGDRAGAVALLEADPAADRQVLLRLGEIRLEGGDPARALEAYRRLLARDPADQEAHAAARRAREVLELSNMPAEYRQIFDADTITRADLAALAMVKVTALARLETGPPRVAVDVGGSWARDHILRSLALDVMTVYPNHTFQPSATVRRGDLARLVQRVLDLLKVPAGPAPRITDMSTANLFHAPASRAVGAGLMDLTAGGAFEPWRPVPGREAAAVLENLARLVGP